MKPTGDASANAAEPIADSSRVRLGHRESSIGMGGPEPLRTRVLSQTCASGVGFPAKLRQGGFEGV